MQVTNHAREGSTLTLKFRTDVNGSPKQGYIWSHKQEFCPPIFLKKILFESGLLTLLNLFTNTTALRVTMGSIRCLPRCVPIELLEITIKQICSVLVQRGHRSVISLIQMIILDIFVYIIFHGGNTTCVNICHQKENNSGKITTNANLI